MFWQIENHHALPEADLAIFWKILKSGAPMIADNPDQAGFIGLYYPRQAGIQGHIQNL